MKYENFGCFYFKNYNYSAELIYKTNYISLRDSITVSDSLVADTIIAITIDSQKITVVNIDQEVYVNDVLQLKTRFHIKENDRIRINGNEYRVVFKSTSIQKLVELIDMFLDGTLPEYFDVQNLFMEYAKEKRITNKQAAMILASIDIPELDISNKE